MRNVIESINQSISSVFATEDLMPQYNAIKSDIVNLCCALQEKVDTVDIVSTGYGTAISHKFNGDRERHSFNNIALSQSDLKQMRELRTFLGRTLELLKGEAA